MNILINIENNKLKMFFSFIIFDKNQPEIKFKNKYQ